MRGPLQVPKSQEEGLSRLLNLSDDDAASLERGLREATCSSSIRALASSVSTASGLSDTHVYSMVRVLSSLYTTRDRLEIDLSELAVEIEKAARESGREDLASPRIGWDKARERLAHFLSLHDSLGITTAHRIRTTRKTVEEATPRTDLGRRLMAIRKSIVESGVPLLTWDEIREEISKRRGEI